MNENESSKVQFQIASEYTPETEEPPLKSSEKSLAFKTKFYSDATLEEWNDWHWQIRHSITSYEELKRIFGDSEYELSEDINLPLRITPYYASTITTMTEGICKCVIHTQN